MELLNFFVQFLGIITGTVIFALVYGSINKFHDTQEPHEGKSEGEKI